MELIPGADLPDSLELIPLDLLELIPWIDPPDPLELIP